MHPVSTHQVLDAMNWRYATKQFDPGRKIAPDVWRALEESLRLAPSSFGLQPWKFIVVENPSVRKELQAASWNQAQVSEASHLVVMTRRTSMGIDDVNRFADRIAEVRGVPRSSFQAYIDMMTGWVSNPSPGFDVNAWSAKQVYLALGFFLQSAAMLGIDACPMEGFDASAYDRILGLAGTGYSTTVIATAGYRAATDKYAGLAKVRFATEEVIERR